MNILYVTNVRNKESCPFTIRSAKLDSDEAEWTLTYRAMKRLSRYFTAITCEVWYTGLFTRKSTRMLSSHTQHIVNKYITCINILGKLKTIVRVHSWYHLFLSKDGHVYEWEYNKIVHILTLCKNNETVLENTVGYATINFIIIAFYVQSK